MMCQQIDRLMRRVMKQANTIGDGKKIRLHAHVLRHTSVKHVHDKKGPVAARKHGRHSTFKQLARYASETREEREASADEVWS